MRLLNNSLTSMNNLSTNNVGPTHILSTNNLFLDNLSTNNLSTADNLSAANNLSTSIVRSWDYTSWNNSTINDGSTHRDWFNNSTTYNLLSSGNNLTSEIIAWNVRSSNDDWRFKRSWDLFLKNSSSCGCDNLSGWNTSRNNSASYWDWSTWVRVARSGERYTLGRVEELFMLFSFIFSFFELFFNNSFFFGSCESKSWYEKES